MEKNLQMRINTKKILKKKNHTYKENLKCDLDCDLKVAIIKVLKGIKKKYVQITKGKHGLHECTDRESQ